MIQLAIEEKKENLGVKLKVIGIGGAGGNAVNSMIVNSGINGIEFLVANTDVQALNLSSAETKIQIGTKITKGLGAGSKPDIGKRSAEEDLDAIMNKISDSDILFLTAGFGGGTGSGALPVIAKAAKDLGILTIAVVTTPFIFEGKRRLSHADEAIKNLKDSVDTLIIVPNQKLLEQADPKISMLGAFAMSDDVLKQAIKGISDIITRAGHINVDFADVKEVMKDMGMAIMGIGCAEGEDRAKKAALKAINSPLLEDVDINGAKAVLINITGNIDLGLHEINEAATLIYDMVSPDAQIILGSVIDQNMDNELMITVIATGFEKSSETFKAASKTKKVINSSKESLLESKKQHNSNNKLEDIKIESNMIEDEMKTIPSNIYSDSFDLKDIDTPTFLRKKAEENVINVSNKFKKNIDIETFNLKEPDIKEKNII